MRCIKIRKKVKSKRHAIPNFFILLFTFLKFKYLPWSYIIFVHNGAKRFGKIYLVTYRKYR